MRQRWRSWFLNPTQNNLLYCQNPCSVNWFRCQTLTVQEVSWYLHRKKSATRFNIELPERCLPILKWRFCFSLYCEGSRFVFCTFHLLLQSLIQIQLLNIKIRNQPSILESEQGNSLDKNSHEKKKPKKSNCVACRGLDYS